MRKLLVLFLAFALAACTWPAPLPPGPTPPLPPPTPTPPQPGPTPPAPTPPAPPPPPAPPAVELPTWAVAAEVVRVVLAGAQLSEDDIKGHLGTPFDSYSPPPPPGGKPQLVAGYKVQDAEGTGTRNVWVTYEDGVSVHAVDR